MKILITGATGMVGKNLLALLSHDNTHTVLAPTRSEVDLLNQTAVRNFFKTHQPDLIIHLAAKVGGIQANIDEPVNFLVENSLINTHVIYGALNAGITKLINLGSSCMYPKDRDILHEKDLLTGMLEPTNEGYAIAKIAAGLLCEYINRQYGFAYKTLIPTNLYGPYDNFDPIRSHLIPAIIRKIHEAQVKELPEVTIWGDGQARREFMYVEDLTRFIVTAMQKIDELPNFINVGLGYDYSVLEYYQTVANLIGYQGKFVFDLSKPSGMRKKLLDVTRVKEFGWTAQTALEQGLKKTYNFFLKNYNQ